MTSKSRLASWLFGLILFAVPVRADTTVRAVMNGDLRSLDPLWTIAPQTRIHAYMVYDTLFGTDAQGVSQPQMVDTWTVSDDKLTYRFKLRDKLAFSDGTPVASTDVIASLKRWMLVDSAGQYIAQALGTGSRWRQRLRHQAQRAVSPAHFQPRQALCRTHLYLPRSNRRRAAGQ